MMSASNVGVTCSVGPLAELSRSEGRRWLWALCYACALGVALNAQCLAQTAVAAPDLLELRPLAAHLVASSTQRQGVSDGARNSFLRPAADQVDELAVGEFYRRPAALAWVAEHMSKSVLIRRADWRELQTRLNKLPDAAVDRWWNESVVLRQQMDGDDWQITEEWLAAFLDVQAMYSPDELTRFHASLAWLTADELLEVIDHFQHVHDQRQRRQRISQQMRTDALRANRELRSLSTATHPSSIYTSGGYSSGTPYPARAPRLPGYAARTSLSQRVSQIYIYRSLWGNNFMWLGW